MRQPLEQKSPLQTEKIPPISKINQTHFMEQEKISLGIHLWDELVFEYRKAELNHIPHFWLTYLPKMLPGIVFVRYGNKNKN